jgi:hypothetical protein
MEARTRDQLHDGQEEGGQSQTAAPRRGDESPTPVEPVVAAVPEGRQRLPQAGSPEQVVISDPPDGSPRWLQGRAASSESESRARRRGGR